MAVADILTGPVKVYYAAVGTAIPARDTVAYGAAWTAPWTALGYTKEGLTVNYETEELEVMIQEALAAVKRVRTKESLTLESVLAELTGTNLALLVGQAKTTGAAGAGVVGYEELLVGGAWIIPEKAWGFEGLYTDTSGNSLPVRFYIFKGTARVNGELQFSKEEYPGIAFQVQMLEDPTGTRGARSFEFQKVTAPATA